MADEAATASGTLPVVKISFRARVRLVAITAHGLPPPRPSGITPASSSALSTPTLHAPRLPPPPRTKTSRRCLSPPGGDEFRRRRHQDSMEGDRQNPVSRIEVTYKIPIRAC